jgi:hypothetical protein
MAFRNVSYFFNYLWTPYQLHKAEENKYGVPVGNPKGRDQ